MTTRILLEPQGGEGNGGQATQEKAPERAQGDATTTQAAPDLTKAVEGLLARHGDATAALRVLLGENYSHRDEIRALRGRLPAEGAIVLAGDDAKHWSAYRQLGTPADVRKAIEEGKTSATALGSLRKAETDRAAAEVAGFRSSVLATLAKDLELEVVEEKSKDGKAVTKVARVKGEGDTRTPLAEYAQQHWKDFLPSLKSEPERRAPGSPTGRIERPVPSSGAGQGNAPKRPRSLF